MLQGDFIGSALINIDAVWHTVMTQGFAAFTSRFFVTMKSIVVPYLSTARYEYRHLPLIS